MNRTFEGVDYKTNQPMRLKTHGRTFSCFVSASPKVSKELYLAPGLVDLQINGYMGVDFNTPKLTTTEFLKATNKLFEAGVTTYYPTIITNSDLTIETILKTIIKSCENNQLIQDCIGGIHLEGPFISKKDGPRGAHPQAYIKAPDLNLIERWQNLARGRIKILTMSPEWPGSVKFIEHCKQLGISVAIGHTSATPDQIRQAIEAGATLSTHIGNACHAYLPRHENYIFEQLASDRLWSTIIADGFHIPDSLLKILLRIKPSKNILVSDATFFAGLPSGSYTSHIGGQVVLDASGRLFMNDSPNMLAGSAQSLLWCVNQLIKKGMASIQEAWEMASVKPREAILKTPQKPWSEGELADMVLFKTSPEGLQVVQTIKAGEIVFSAS